MKLPAIRLLHASPPKARSGGTPTASTSYTSMNQDYRWFRQDELVRRAILANAYYAAMSAGFETRLEQEGDGDYSWVKRRVDEANQRVNMDLFLFVAQVKRSIYGRAGFEIVPGKDGAPERLISLQSDRLQPEVGSDWNLAGFTYQGRSGFYRPGEVLYFVNASLEADWNGLSDVEPVRDLCAARHEVLRENFREIARNLWAPYVVLKADTGGLSREEAEKTVDSLAEVARAGRSIAVNESVEATVVDLTPDIDGLTRLLDKLEQGISANFGVPRMLLGRPVENRATAYAELEAYYAGTIAQAQRYLKREVERQWYAPLVEQMLAEEGASGAPVRVKHSWKPLRASDTYEMAKAVSALWGSNGDGALGGDVAKAWSLMGWSPEGEP